VYYVNVYSNYRFRRVGLEGSHLQDISGWVAPGVVVGSAASFSADGKQVAYQAAINSLAARESPARIALVGLGSGRAPRQIAPDPRMAFSEGLRTSLSFTPDGKAIAYPIRQNGGDNVWVQPLDGAPGRQITHFTSEAMLRVLWSPDGKHLALLRSLSNANIVLLRTRKP
ncbi:MAG: TolB family protein, partial [Terriglobia bacterium]